VEVQQAGGIHQQLRRRAPASASQQGKDERKIITNWNIKKGHTAQFPKKERKKYSNTLLTITAKAGALVTSNVPL
jgi:hypothetical protein